jgi:hypothetical protein
VIKWTERSLALPLQSKVCIPALVVVEWSISAHSRTTAQRHGDFAGRLRRDSGSADGRDKDAVAGVAGEEELRRQIDVFTDLKELQSRIGRDPAERATPRGV